VRQIRTLQAAVCVLLLATGLLVINCIWPLIPRQRFALVEAERINIRERDGTLRAALSNAKGFTEGQRAQQQEGARIAGLMFYNEEGQEAGGLVYLGKAVPGGQDAEAALTFDQFRQDQTVYLNHEEHRDAQGTRIADGLSVNSRPDWTKVRDEYRTYEALDKVAPSQQDEAKLEALQAGKISTGRLFIGVKRGVNGGEAYDDGGIFIKNKWGRTVIKLYVDYDNRPHFEVYDPLGKALIYELKVPASQSAATPTGKGRGDKGRGY
jgi:hypothetical protein